MLYDAHTPHTQSQMDSLAVCTLSPSTKVWPSLALLQEMSGRGSPSATQEIMAALPSTAVTFFSWVMWGWTGDGRGRGAEEEKQKEKLDMWIKQNRVNGRRGICDLTHQGGEITMGFNTELMHDFATDSLGQHHLYTAVKLSRPGSAGSHALWPILCTSWPRWQHKKLTFVQVWYKQIRTTSPSVRLYLFFSFK